MKSGVLGEDNPVAWGHAEATEILGRKLKADDLIEPVH